MLFVLKKKSLLVYESIIGVTQKRAQHYVNSDSLQMQYAITEIIKKKHLV